MELKTPAVAGTLESSDIQIALYPNPGQGIQIRLQSDVKALFGEAIEATLRQVLAEFGVEDALVDANDKGALDFAIRARMDELAAKRKEKQPLEYPSAGSMFKRPEGHFAAALIDQCGLKGLSVGGAQVSEKHAGFVVNRGGATCADVLELVERVRARVLAETGVELEMEVRVLR